MVEQEIGKRIKYYRKQCGLTQEQISEKVDLSTTYISAVERGLYSISLNKLVDILNCLGCSADDVFGDVLVCRNKYKASELSEKIEKLPKDEQVRILEVLETLINTAKK